MTATIRPYDTLAYLYAELSDRRNGNSSFYTEFRFGEIETLIKALELYRKVDDEVAEVSPSSTTEDDSTIPLAIENARLRDEIEKMTKRDAKGRLLLDKVVSVQCMHLHHEPSQYHKLGDSCPVEELFEQYAEER